MRSLILFVFLFLFVQSHTAAQQTITATIMHDGQEREYILYVPAVYTGMKEVPLVLNFHGYGSNAFQQMWYGDFRAIADTANFLIVHPQGTLFNGSTHFNVGGWTLGSPTDDVGFTAALIDSLSAQYSIDQDRIYATGMSNGGFMSFVLACQLSERITAIASVTGSMTPETYNTCDPTHPMPVLQIHGTADLTVPYGGALWTKPIQDVLDYWVDVNDCTPIPIVTDLPNIAPQDGSTVQRRLYEDGDNGATVAHFMVTGGGHTWPGTIFGSAGTNQDINASVEIWRFFNRYTKSGLSMPTSLHLTPHVHIPISIYPNPAKEQVTISPLSDDYQPYKLLTMTGISLKSGIVQPGQDKLDLQALPPGYYFLQIGQEILPLTISW